MQQSALCVLKILSIRMETASFSLIFRWSDQMSDCLLHCGGAWIFDSHAITMISVNRKWQAEAEGKEHL